jgi:hypothetical protein
VTAQDKLNFRSELFERDHEVSVFLTGNSKNVFDAFFFQTLYKQIGRFHRLKFLV